MSTFVEQDCTIKHEGRTAEAGGAFVSDDYAVVYIASDGVSPTVHGVTDWHGNNIGRAHQTSTWTVGGTRVYSYAVTIFGGGYKPCGAGRCTARHYNMRGQGAGMMARGRRTLAS